MKHFIQTFSLVVLISSVFFTQSCRKPKPVDPCNNKITVTATEQSMHYLGHFELPSEITNGFAPSQTYLFANNYSKFASKIVAGREYKIGFKYVECKKKYTQECGFGDEYRCGTPIIKCIEILCLEEVPSNTGCYGVEFDNPAFENTYSRAVSDAKIIGHSLNVNAYFSGCSQNDNVKFGLYLREIPVNISPNAPIIYEAKVAELNNGYTCQAVFNKNACFDLSGLANNYKKNNRAIPSKIIIRLHIGEKTTDLTYITKP